MASGESADLARVLRSRRVAVLVLAPRGYRLVRSIALCHELSVLLTIQLSTAVGDGCVDNVPRSPQLHTNGFPECVGNVPSTSFYPRATSVFPIFPGLPEQSLACLQGILSFAVRLWESWTRSCVFKSPLLREFLKLPACELWSVIKTAGIPWRANCTRN